MKIILKADKNTTIKELLKANFFSPALISKLEKNGLYTLDYINKDETISILLPNEETSVKLENQPLNIIYEDDYIIAINKEKNIATIPSIRHYDSNIANRLMYYFNSKNIHSTVHPINRLDYKTSGIVLFAKHQYIHHLFSQITIDKYYKATIHNHLLLNEGYLSFPIYHNQNIKREINQLGKKSLTYFKVIGYNENVTTVLIKLLTGRTHQIRLHFSYLGYPLVGDDLYGNDYQQDLLLECYKLCFVHPIYRKQVIIEI